MSSLPRVYYSSTKQALYCGAILELESFQSVRIGFALRMRKGEEIILFNERDGSFFAVILNIQSTCVVEILRFLKQPEQLKPLTVGIPLIKNHRFNFILESITQLGVTSIVPIKFDRSNIVGIKMDKCLKQLIGATEQCGRHSVPLILEPLSVSEFLSEHELIVCANERSEILLTHSSELVAKASSLSVLIGPEGGFSEDEQELLQNASNVTNVSLGDLILRSEVAVSSVISQTRLFY
jgi:16S rRNA (uracil1498-N3)-methyltransferase